MNFCQTSNSLMIKKTGSDCARLRTKFQASKFNVFKQGFSFTVIKPPSSEGLLPGLTFWNNRKAFLNDLELSEPVIEEESDEWRVEDLVRHKFFDHPNFSSLPRVVFRWGGTVTNSG